jgi:hypothetical protein
VRTPDDDWADTGAENQGTVLEPGAVVHVSSTVPFSAPGTWKLWLCYIVEPGAEECPDAHGRRLKRLAARPLTLTRALPHVDEPRTVGRLGRPDSADRSHHAPQTCVLASRRPSSSRSTPDLETSAHTLARHSAAT